MGSIISGYRYSFYAGGESGDDPEAIKLQLSHPSHIHFLEMDPVFICQQNAISAGDFARLEWRVSILYWVSIFGIITLLIEPCVKGCVAGVKRS